ncbi:MAG: hypothetical protein CM15mP102_18130 [Flavobacteriales bacterium]|nr:MAG: hypothetical protein CM15mP102_18130 [Flavobacteriales bacterium]
MVPRAEIIALENLLTLKCKKIFIETGFQNPIYKNSIDDIVGYIHSFDFLKNLKILMSYPPVVFVLSLC